MSYRRTPTLLTATDSQNFCTSSRSAGHGTLSSCPNGSCSNRISRAAESCISANRHPASSFSNAASREPTDAVSCQSSDARLQQSAGYDRSSWIRTANSPGKRSSDKRSANKPPANKPPANKPPANKSSTNEQPAADAYAYAYAGATTAGDGTAGFRFDSADEARRSRIEAGAVREASWDASTDGCFSADRMTSNPSSFVDTAGL